MVEQARQRKKWGFESLEERRKNFAAQQMCNDKGNQNNGEI
jgi:hypothetical protein